MRSWHGGTTVGDLDTQRPVDHFSHHDHDQDHSGHHHDYVSTAVNGDRIRED